MRFYLLFLCLFVVQPTWSLTLDWKGFSRTEVYYEASSETSYYGNFHLILKPEIQVVDGLSVFSRLDLYSFDESFKQSYLLGERQTGVIFSKGIKSSEEKLKPLFLNLSQIYITYETEFFKLKLGRAPYHFGLGITYSAETSPFDHWISTFNQLAFYFEYSSFYVQPSIFLTSDKDALSVNQIGLQGDNWNIETLIRYSLKSSKFFIETFGAYKDNFVDTKLSLSYFSEDEDQLKLAVIFEGGVDLPIGLSPRFEVKSGYVSKEFFVHPNYDVALLLGNRLTHPVVATQSESTLNELIIAEGRISDKAYVSPRLSFSFLQDTLKITPIVSVDYILSLKKLHYEFDLQAHYNLEENFSILIQGGVLPSAEKIYYGLLAQAAVTF